MDTPNPLATGNRFQRAYYRWALPYYERFGREDPLLRERVELVDIYLYTRRGLGAWAGWWLVFVGVTVWLMGHGLGWAGAVGLSLALWGSVSFVLLGVWTVGGMKLPLLKIGLLGCGGFLAGFAVRRYDLLGINGLLDRSLPQEALWPALSSGGAVLVGGVLVVAVVARAGRMARERQLARLQLVAERDAAARAAAEADLRLLQAQIHPHFVFNTLATLQHWVDGRDERAGPLLRELSGFLRRSTEMLGRPTVPLADEAQAVRHYLAILDARLEGRVRGEVAIDPALAAEPLPPGLLLTLVENAVEHGLEPRIGGGQVWVSATREAPGPWRLRVDDDGLGLAAEAEDDVGLTNLRQRLKHHFGDRARFVLQPRAGGGTRAEITFTP